MMVSGFAWLLVFQLAGEVMVRGLQLPVPGPVLGMLLLLLVLIWRGGPSDNLRNTSQGLLGTSHCCLCPLAWASWCMATALPMNG